MKRFIWLVMIMASTCLWAESYTPAEVPNPKTEGQQHYVSNPDDILADSSVIWLNTCASMLESKTNVELCVVALESIDDADAFDFAYELFQRWGIGRKGQNTGVLILFVLDSHDLRIMTGTGIEGVLTDAKCSQIMHDDMFPAFRNGDYDAGICLGALDIYETCTNGDAPEELLTIRSVTNRGQYAEEEGWTLEDWMIAIAILFPLSGRAARATKAVIPATQVLPAERSLWAEEASAEDSAEAETSAVRLAAVPLPAVAQEENGKRI